MTQYWQRGESIDYTNPGTEAIQHNEVVLLGNNRIGIAGCDIVPKAVGSLHVTGVFIMPKAAGAVEVGAPVYWDSSANNITTIDTDMIPAGWAIEPAAAGDVTIKVKIGG